MSIKRNSKKIKKFTIKMQAKLLLVFCILLICLIGLIGRLIYLNRTDGDKYKKRVLSQQTYSTSVIPYQRGDIVDRKGTILATSQKVYNVILDVKKLLSDKEYLTPTLLAVTKTFTEITESDINDIIQKKPNSQYVILKKKLSYDDVTKFKELAAENKNIQGIWFEEDYVRTYPYSTLASSILGFTISGNIGTWGLEQFYNEELNGTNGKEYGYIDKELKLERTVKPAVNGNTIVSTIDANVQGIVQNHIKSFNEEFGSKNIGVIVMNPNNGEVLAMASNSEYDLNNPTDLSHVYTKEEIELMSEEEKQTALNQMWRNFTISDGYEPGSTFKPFTIAAGLDEDIIQQDDTFVCDGHEIVGGWTIRCSKRSGHGTITLMESLMKSCNDAMMNIVAREGKNLFYKYQTFFGFGTKTGIDLPGETAGLLVEEDKISVSDLATSSFGQTFTTSMIQLATSFSSLINGGYYYEPHMVKQIVNDKGATVKNIDKVLVKETVSKETSDFIKESMYQTVEAGTASGAKVPGYKVGGKTGTAQKYPRGNGNYVVSFIGAVPADNPEIVIYVVIDEPQNVIQQADSSIATKLTSRILTEILPFLELYPTEEVEEEDDKEVTTAPTLPSTNEEHISNDNEESTNSSEESSGEIEDSSSNTEGGNNSSKEPDDKEENQSEEDNYEVIPSKDDNTENNTGDNTESNSRVNTDELTP